MKLKFIVLLLVLAMTSGCSIFKRDKTGYEDSDSVSDLEMPPELNLPKRDSNYDIPETDAVEPQEEAVQAEVVEEVDAAAIEDMVEKAEGAMEEVEEAVEEAVDTSE